MLKFTTLAVLATLCATSAQAITLTFDERGTAGGDLVTSFSKGGVTGTVSATGGSNQAMVFDTNKLTGEDADLLAPFFKFFNPERRDIYPNNVLIISEDGNSEDPDDNATGGTITFKFDQLINFTGFRVFDDVTDFVVTSDKGDTSTPVTLDNDNQWARVQTAFTGVRELTFDFGNASGAIDDLKFDLAPVPVPASLPLLLAGFGALGVMRRRKSAPTA